MTHIAAHDRGEGAVERGGERSRWATPRCGYRANAFMLWVASKVLWVGYLFVLLVAAYFFVMHGAKRRASAAFLDRVRGRRGMFRRWWETYRHLVTFGVLLLDRALMLAEAKHGFEIEGEGMIHLAEAARGAEGRGLVLLSAHFGMTEIAAPYLRMIGYTMPVHIVMYQDPTNGMEQFHSRHRRMLEHVGIISTVDPLAAGLRIVAALRQGDMVGMRADRTLDGKTVNAELLGEALSLPAGPFVAADLCESKVVYIDTVRVGYRRYRCVVTPSGFVATEGMGREERVSGMARDFAGHLDQVLRRYPYQWANFFDLWAAQPPHRKSDRPTSPISAAS